MKTEDIQRTQRSSDSFAVSRALQELTPHSCAIVDHRGRAVPLSSAGYVLRFGKSYRLQIISPLHGEAIQEIRIFNEPPFIKTGPAALEHDAEGRLVRCLPFKVSLDYWDLWTAAGKFGLGIYSDELEVMHLLKPGHNVDGPPVFRCPVIVRPGWYMFATAVVLALVCVLFEKLVRFALSEAPIEERIESIRGPLSSMETWFLLGGIATAIWLLVTTFNLWLIYRRSCELCNEFHEMYST
jgi:hypothetical protein